VGILSLFLTNIILLQFVEVYGPMAAELWKAAAIAEPTGSSDVDAVLGGLGMPWMGSEDPDLAPAARSHDMASFRQHDWLADKQQVIQYATISQLGSVDL
jgi:hypothetical protein